MHTQNEQKKCQISHNELIDNALSTFAPWMHETGYIKLHAGYIFFFSQPVGTKRDAHKLHKLHQKTERELYIRMYSRFSKKINKYITHCAEHRAIKKPSRYMSLYKYICNLCNLCNFLIYLLISSRVRRVTCFIILCNFAQFYVTSYIVSRFLVGVRVHGEHSTCAEIISFNYVHNHALGAPLSLCCT